MSLLRDLPPALTCRDAIASKNADKMMSECKIHVPKVKSILLQKYNLVYSSN